MPVLASSCLTGSRSSTGNNGSIAETRLSVTPKSFTERTDTDNGKPRTTIRFRSKAPAWARFLGGMGHGNDQPRLTVSIPSGVPIDLSLNVTMGESRIDLGGLTLSELGLDLSAATTTTLTPELAAGVSMLITMGCGDQCPIVPGVKRDDWPLADPKGQPLERVRAIRDDIRGRVQALVEQQGWGRPVSF